ncbi:MAG: hypothetical protein RIC55_00820 [Pirellulaceae bacterium]
MNDDLLAEIEDVGRRRTAVHNRRNELEERVRSLRRAAESDLYEIGHVIYQTQAKQLKERAEQQQAKADALEPEIAAIVATIEEFDKHETELRRRMLEP